MKEVKSTSSKNEISKLKKKATIYKTISCILLVLCTYSLIILVMDCVKIALYDKIEAKIVENTEGKYVNSNGKEVKGNYLEISYNYKDNTYSSQIGIYKFMKDYYKDKDIQKIYVNEEHPNKYVYFNIIAFIGLALQIIINLCVYLRYRNLNNKIKELKC